MADSGSYMCSVVGQESRYFAIATLDVQSCKCRVQVLSNVYRSTCTAFNFLFFSVFLSLCTVYLKIFYGFFN